MLILPPGTSRWKYWAKAVTLHFRTVRVYGCSKTLSHSARMKFVALRWLHLPPPLLQLDVCFSPLPSKTSLPLSLNEYLCGYNPAHTSVGGTAASRQQQQKNFITSFAWNVFVVFLTLHSWQKQPRAVLLCPSL